MACIGLEIALRVTDAVPEVGSPLYNFHESDSYLGWIGKPGVRVRYHRPEFDTLVLHDAEGWRAPDPPRPSNPARRILVLGDSFTWGWGVTQGELFTDHLQARLGPAVAIYNRGAIGFGTAQEYLLLQRELARTKYDAVVLMFFINDLADNGDGKDGHRPYFELNDGKLEPRNQPATARTNELVLFCKQYSRAYNFIEFELGMFKRRFAGQADDEKMYAQASGVDFHALPNYAVTARLLGEMNRLAREHGARFYLVYIPQRSEFERDAVFPYVQSVRDMVDDIAKRESIAVIDLAPPFRARAQAGQHLTFAIDAHWSPAGHELAAEVLLASPIFADGDGAMTAQNRP